MKILSVQFKRVMQREVNLKYLAIATKPQQKNTKGIESTRLSFTRLNEHFRFKFSNRQASINTLLDELLYLIINRDHYSIVMRQDFQLYNAVFD